MTDSSGQYAVNRLGNAMHTIIIIAAMAALFGVLGWIIFGNVGLVTALVLVLVLALSTPKISPFMVLKMYGARRLTYEEAPWLYETIIELTRRAGLERMPVPYYVPSRVMNAFSVGSKENSAIALSDGLIRFLNRREITGVLAHEISHITNNDLRLHALADVMTRITSSLSFLGQILIILYLPLAVFSQTRISFVLILLLILAPTLSIMLQLALSRTREFDADLTAAHLTDDPISLASALKKMDNIERSIWDTIFLPGRKVPQPSMLRTHPHTKERVERLLSLAPVKKESIPVPHSLSEDIIPGHIPEVHRLPSWHWFRPWY